MTAVASPPSFPNINRQAWGGQSINAMTPDDVRGGIFVPARKTIQRTNSASSIASTSSNSSAATVTSAAPLTNGTPVSAAGDLSGWPNPAPRKRPQAKAQWQPGKPDGPSDFVRLPGVRPQGPTGVNGASSLHQPSPILPSQGQVRPQGGMPRQGEQQSAVQPMLCLLSLNGTFEQKKIAVPFFPETLRIGRQTNAKTVPTPANGFFDSKVLSRQHAEIWADQSGKIWIRDVKSSNGTFVNGQRLSQENRESEPHELQSQDQLELGIDIVSEDQKTVVHHKVAAKVEHAGFMNPSTSLLDLNFGDLDPSNGTMMMPMTGIPIRGRAGSQASLGANGRVAPSPSLMNGQPNGLGHPRQFWMTPITTEHIIKKLHAEMRNARLQNQDLNRTGQFISALLSKEDLKQNEKPEVPEPPIPHMVNGNGIPFRAEAGKTRFSDPPAPPPQQPLPEKPDIPSLKRGTTERPKSHPPNSSTTSPIRQDNITQIIALQEALNSAKREIDSQTAKMRDLEEMLQREREARVYAEDLVHKLEDAAASKMNGAARASEQESVLEEAFEPPAELSFTVEPTTTPSDQDKRLPTTQAENVEATANLFQARIESMMLEMRDLKQQLDEFKQRAEKAEAERDADRKTLAEMVLQIRQRDEDARRAAEGETSRPASNGRERANSSGRSSAEDPLSTANGAAGVGSGGADSTGDDPADVPTLSRQNTITPATGTLSKLSQDRVLIQGLPYASMIGVVLIGMGLMAYINGWQPQPKLDR